jgi:hypothetical protein
MNIETFQINYDVAEQARILTDIVVHNPWIVGLYGSALGLIDTVVEKVSKKEGLVLIDDLGMIARKTLQEATPIGLGVVALNAGLHGLGGSDVVNAFYIAAGGTVAALGSLPDCVLPFVARAAATTAKELVVALGNVAARGDVDQIINNNQNPPKGN